MSQRTSPIPVITQGSGDNIGIGGSPSTASADIDAPVKQLRLFVDNHSFYFRIYIINHAPEADCLQRLNEGNSSYSKRLLPTSRNNSTGMIDVGIQNEYESEKTPSYKGSTLVVHNCHHRPRQTCVISTVPNIVYVTFTVRKFKKYPKTVDSKSDRTNKKAALEQSIQK